MSPSTPRTSQPKRYTLLARSADAPDSARPGGRPRVRRLTLVRRAQTWPPLAPPEGGPRRSATA